MKKDLSLKIWFFTFLVVLAGLIALYSASFQNMRVSNKVFYDQMVFAGIGFVLMFILSRVDYRIFYDATYVFYALSTGLLVMVLVAGRHALGAQRWVELGGISFQPSEVAKLALILVLARYFSNLKREAVHHFSDIAFMLWQQLLVPLILTGGMMILILKQPDLGTSLLLFGIFIIMLFASEIRYRYFVGFIFLTLSVAPFAWRFLKPYQKDRLLVFLNPNIDPLGAGYTIIQSKIAVGSGQLFGKGWLSGTQNQLNFLPERHTDFIFSVIGEEWGIVGTLFLLCCYAVIIVSGLKIAEQVKDKFGTQLATGIVGILTLQVVINMGMVLGLCPVVGLTLPLVSYGRTSLLVTMIMLGLLLSLSRRRTIF